MKYVLVSWLVVFPFFALANEDIVIGKRVALFSDILDEQRVVSIYTPRSYASRPDKAYAVLYVLDGFGNFFHTLGSHFFLAGYQQMPELIIVGIHHRNRSYDLTPTKTKRVKGSGGAGAFRQFIKEELFDYVDSHYRTQEARFLSGHSLGGLFAVDTMLSAPEMFHAYFTFSPSLRYDNDLILKKLIKQINESKLSGYLYMNIGNEGFKMTRPILEAHEALKGIKQSHLTWKVDWLEDENHSTTPVIGQFNAYRDYFSPFQLSYSDLSLGAQYIDNYYSDLSNKVGYPVPVPETSIRYISQKYFDEKNYQTALGFYALYTKHYPNSVTAYQGLANTYLAMSNEQKAIETLDIAISLAESYQDALLDELRERLTELVSQKSN